MIGEQLRSMCKDAEHSILLVAPFMKATVVTRLLDEVGDRVPVVCVTRWRPDEIAAGVSDLEVWPLFRDHPARTMLLRQDLHAKYYRADSLCFVGSANLTAKALGLVVPSNLELAVPVNADDPAMVDFERTLFSGCVVVNDEVAALMKDAVGALPRTQRSVVDSALVDSNHELVALENWTPRTRQPEDLFIAYAGSSELLSRTAHEAATSDLALLAVPPGLNREEFNRVVGISVLTLPVFRDVDDFLTVERRFGEVVAHLAGRFREDDSVRRNWQTMFRWLIHFLPDRYSYRRPRHSELISRRVPS
jgi:hypothetical protein